MCFVGLGSSGYCLGLAGNKAAWGIGNGRIGLQQGEG